MGDIEDFVIEQLVVADHALYGLDKKWLTDESYRDKTITEEDNIYVSEETCGVVIGFAQFSLHVIALLVSWGGKHRGRVLIHPNVKNIKPIMK